MKKKPTAKPVRPAKRNTKKKTQVTAKNVPESKPSPAPTKGTNPTHSSTTESTEARTADIERLIAEDPYNAFLVATKGFEYSIELIGQLIQRKSLCHTGNADAHFDAAAMFISKRFEGVQDRFRELALFGNKLMIEHVWRSAISFIGTIHDIAIIHPDQLEFLTKRSVFMPSLRAREQRFDYDFPEIAEKTHLSEECLFYARPDAAYNLNKPQNLIVADCLRYINNCTCLLKYLKNKFNCHQQCAAKGCPNCREYASFQLDKWLIDCPHNLQFPSLQPHEIHYDELPPLTKKTVKCWWENAIKGEVERRFKHIKGTAFHTELQKATDSDKDYKVKDEFKRRCRKALESLARPDSKD